MRSKKPHAIRKFLIDNVEKHHRDLVRFTMEKFDLSRPAIHEHLEKLIKSGDIKKTGSKSATVYSKGRIKPDDTWSLPIGKEGDEAEIWQKDFLPRLSTYPKNIQDICYYGVSEMINNAIDHSEGRHLNLSWNDSGSEIKILIGDDGIGIFKKISDALGLEDQREAILHLAKGKFTTDASRHTGQGIFFTSRVFDRFVIMSHDMTYIRTRNEDDWLIETRKTDQVLGTVIALNLDKHTTLRTTDIFRRYTDDDDGFDKTDVFVKLAKLDEEIYISRSQARRLLLGLENFTSVILDFSDVRTVGQGFVDEVFRVYKNTHPSVKISYAHANDDIDFMIRRGLK